MMTSKDKRDSRSSHEFLALIAKPSSADDSKAMRQDEDQESESGDEHMNQCRSAMRELIAIIRGSEEKDVPDEDTNQALDALSDLGDLLEEHKDMSASGEMEEPQEEDDSYSR